MEQEFSLRGEENYENDDFCRGYNESIYKDNLLDNLDENMNALQLNLNDNINDIAPEMPNEFYRNVESFLSKAPPKINDTLTTKIKKIGNKNNKEVNNNKSNSIPTIGLMFPRINNLNPPQPPVNNNSMKTTIISSKVKSKIYNDANKTSKLNIDHKLLQEAFEYTDMLLKESILNEADDMNGDVGEEEYQMLNNNPSKSIHNRSHSLENIYNTTANTNKQTTKNKTNSTNTVGMIKKLRNKSQSNINNHKQSSIGNYHNNDNQMNNHITNNNNNSFIVSNDNDNIDDKKNAINYNDLIANFQDGTTLQKLRKELEESQQNMKKSEDFMKKLSKEFLMNKKR